MDEQPTVKIRTHTDYTVGWVCALPKEQTAATAMLDERHDDLPKPANDSNTYTLGSIGKHNIVIACLPKGHIGNNPAATVATLMVSTFPSVRFGLLVGIGGGIPPKVRLGDVVVSTPVGSFPGVIQWDRGKAKDGSFERTGSLNNPPTSLLTALAKLETEHELAGSRIPEYLDQLKQKWPKLAAKYLKSDSLEDVLFKADYSHVCQSTAEDHISSGSDYESETEDSCQHCDKTKIIKRKPRDMRVHYGLIASGNQVIKSAILRDQLNKDLEGNLLCIEMEAAGLMNNFPCVVIRGICDYADSHKNKDWQEFAAVVATAFAKELLSFMQPSDIIEQRTVRNILGDVFTSVSTTMVVISHIKSDLENANDTQILDWITPVDYGPQQSDFLKRRQPGTGNWLLESEEYKSWMGTRKQTLFCPGIPGAGKTILTSIVINHLEKACKADRTTGIAYIYFNYGRQAEQVIEKLLASLVKQLSQGLDSLPSCVRDMYIQHKKSKTRPSLDEILAALDSVVKIYSRIFIIIDALDECQFSDGCRRIFLKRLSSLQTKYEMNIFMTSRHIPEIVEHFDTPGLTLEIRASTEDIEAYLKGNIDQLPAFVYKNRELQQKIAAEISKAVDGMFLLAQIYLNSLSDKMTPKTIKKTLSNFQKANSESNETEKAAILAQAYEQAMLRINGQQSGFKELAHKVLLWIVCAERQLTTTELQHALAVEIGESELDKENLPSIQDMVSVCAGLVTVDYESNIIRLVHYTAQEYFNQARERWFPNGHIIIADTCASYLLFKVFEEGACRTDSGLRERLELHPLYKYAAHNWGHHAKKASKLCNKVLEFLECKMKVSSSVQVSRVGGHGIRIWDGSESPNGSESPVSETTGLHLAVYFGIEETVKALLEKTIDDINTINGEGLTPLSLSARNGHEAIVRLLLAIPSIKVNFTSSYRSTPLLFAARHGHEAVVKLLLSMPGVDINLCNTSLETPLLEAAQNKHNAVVELLLAAGADPNFGKQAPLLIAVGNGDDAAVKLLLATPSTGINIKSTIQWDPCRHTPLFRAVQNGYDSIVELLLAAGADPNLGSTEQTPLSKAAEKGHEAIVKLLLAVPSIDVELTSPRDAYCDTPLFKATRNGYDSIVELLLAAGADPNLGSTEQTPLSKAAQEGYETIVQLLLATPNIDVNSTDGENCFYTPLLSAVRKGREPVVKMLITAGADVNLMGTDGKTPLFLATCKGHEAIIKLLLAAEADPNIASMDDNCTPLSWAAWKGWETITKLLLAAGADPNPNIGLGQTPLEMAQKGGHETIVQLLSDKGPEVNLMDENTKGESS